MLTSSRLQPSRFCPAAITVFCYRWWTWWWTVCTTADDVNTVICWCCCVVWYSEMWIWSFIKWWLGICFQLMKFDWVNLPVTIRKRIVISLIPISGFKIENFCLQWSRVQTTSNKGGFSIRSQSIDPLMRKLRWWFSFESFSIESEIKNKLL